MATRGFLWLAAVASVGCLGGCVDRRFVVETNVPGAQVTVDGKPIGPSPADGWYEYAGYYEFQAVAPGYEPLREKVRFRPHWYDYPGLDFFAEVLWPFRIEDVRRVRLDLQPAQPTDTDQLIAGADALRERGRNLPPQSVPDQEPGSPSDNPPGPGRTIPPIVPPPFPSAIGSGVPGTLPPAGPGINNPTPGGYGTFNR